MKQVLICGGQAVTEEVPVPAISSGEVLVRLHASCLSVGTEMSGVRSSAIPLWRRAVQQPEKIVAAGRLIAEKGLKHTWNLIDEKRTEARPTGYSAAGVVVEVGEDVKDFCVGDRVACGGGGYAMHAEYVRVPVNLCALLPENISWAAASTVTLGAIALQGLRRAQPTLGETFVVIGLGILGQLTVQLLRANGCRTIGIDIDTERLEIATRMGMEIGLDADTNSDNEQVARLTGGLGADGVIITAATTSDAVVSQAFKVCRKKGRVVIVGDVGLNLNRDDFYAKEIDFLISTSYGPGRYDHRYEEMGLDYPAAYVRWTENRNMVEYLRLIAEQRIDVEPLVSASYPVADANQAYASLQNGNQKPLMVLLTYASGETQPERSIPTGIPVSTTQGIIRIAVIGAGAFARANHLPNLIALKDRFAIQTVVSRSGHTAAAAARQFGAVNASTDYEEVLADPDVDAVIIATRHHLHADMALRALRAGKHALVEKPLCLNTAELEAIDQWLSEQSQQSSPVLMTGYNRRFSPYAERLAKLVEGRSGAFMFDYRMNAGHIPRHHWVHGAEGGGRNLGEACHIYDLFTFLADTEIVLASAVAISPKSSDYFRNDNFVATIRFADGSVASLTYSASGSTDYAKETAELFVDGKTAVLTDYKQLEFYGSKLESLTTSRQEKGFDAELIAFAEGINRGHWPIPWWQQKQVARVALEIEVQLNSS